MPCSPRDSKTMSHTAERCRCRPSGPGGTICVEAGSGCLGARVTRSGGGWGPSAWCWAGGGGAGVGGPQVKKSPLQPILGVRGGGQPMVAAVGHHQQHVPPLQLNGVPARLPGLPRAWCRMSGDHA